MSVATEDWLERRGRQPYTQEQLRMLAEAILAGETSFPKEMGEELLVQMGLEEHSYRNGQQSKRRDTKDTERSTELAKTGRGMAGENN